MFAIKRNVVIFWLILFFINFGYASGWAGVYSILIKKIGTENLPHFFLYSALAGFVLNIVMLFYSNILKSTKLLSFSFLATICVLCTYITIYKDLLRIPLSFYKSSLIFSAVLISAIPSVYLIQLWNLINKTFTTNQGISVYPILSSAPLVGSMIGGIIAQNLPRYFEVDILIIIWISCLTLCAIANCINKKNFSQTEQIKIDVLNNFVEGILFYKKSAFAKDLSIVFMLFWFVCTLIDFCYAQILDISFSTPEKIASFYGIYTFISNCLALIIQLFLGALIIKKIGIKIGFIFLPISQILGFISLIFIPGLISVVIMMSMQTLIGMTIQSNSVSVSFNIFPEKMRGKIRTILEGIINPLGGVLASELLIFFKIFLGTKQLTYWVPYIGMFFVLIWLFTTFHIQKTFIIEAVKSKQSSLKNDVENAQQALLIENTNE
ncbi:MAG: hypothetical protein MJ250_00105 [Alphaproteobacteria bacterium]|nr:hypothetical protein [Alphaproteobacteria bacterium]